MEGSCDTVTTMYVDCVLYIYIINGLQNELIEVWSILVYAVYILLMHYMHTFKKINILLF